MTEEIRQLRKENAEIKEALAQKDQRIEELGALLMRALLRIEELERRLGKNSQNSSNPLPVMASRRLREPASPKERQTRRRTSRAPGTRARASRDA